MRVLVTGGQGQVGAELRRLAWGRGHEVAVTDRKSLDISDAGQVRQVVRQFDPEVIVNCAAYTAVDRAEDEPELAFLANDTAVGVLADAADASRSALIHMSTDYVFDGTKDGWYVETDPTNPMGVYGASKLAGEARALSAERGLVLRTAWVYGALGQNFVRTMRRLSRERDELSVVNDQVGCPTGAKDIARGIQVVLDQGLHSSGVFHLAAPDQATWWELALAAIGHTERAGAVEIHAITTAEFPTKAARPQNSRLDSTAFALAYDHRLPSWEASLAEVSAELDQREAT